MKISELAESCAMLTRRIEEITGIKGSQIVVGVELNVYLALRNSETIKTLELYRLEKDPTTAIERLQIAGVQFVPNKESRK